MVCITDFFVLEVDMRIISASELQKREVINLCTGEKLGFICDFEFDIETGCIISVSVLSQNEIPFFRKKEEYVIPWKRIECIGEDTVLVNIPKDEMCSFRKCKR